MSLQKDSYTWVWVYVGAFLIVCAILGVILSLSRPQVTVQLGDGIFKASIAATPKAREKGLSGVKQLSATEALLFVFKQDGQYEVWMKDMHIPIDVVWLDKDKKVISIEKNMQPDSYPKTYAPKTNARYVIEFSAGTINSKAITVGSRAYFDISQIKEIQ